MAEAISTDIGSKMIEKSGSAIFKIFMSVKDRKSNIETLRKFKSTIEAELHKYDPYEVSTDLEKIQCLRRLHEKMVQFFEELAASAMQKEVMSKAEKSRMFFSSSNQLVSLFVTTKKVNALMKELKSSASDNAQCSSLVSHCSGVNHKVDALIQELRSIDSQSSVQNRNRFTSTVETSPYLVTQVVIGRDRDKENIVNKVCNSSNDHDRVVAIVGVGGLGKTTLAQCVCQDDRVKRSFDECLWVSLTPKSTLNEILQKMIISATGQEPIFSSLEYLHKHVIEAFDGKKCLLVLDNVYYSKHLSDESEELSAILEHGCFWRNGGKVLITSRSKKVAAYMHSFKPYELHDLAEADCWRLLRHYANEDDNNDCAVEAVGKEIVRMCPKVPLVLKTIGRYLADIDKSQWETFKNQLASNPTMYIEQQDKIKQILKLCYDQLDYNLKHCAAYCSLFPKGHLYDKDYMVRNWIVLGYVESRDAGDAYVLELTQRAFFEEAGSFKFFKIHDVIHDLMHMIGKDKHQMIDSKTKDIGEGVRHVSLNMEHLRWDVLLSSTNDKQALESIILGFSRWEDRDEHGVRLGSDIDTLILACRNLKILEIYKQDINKVPRCIGKLTNMRHLDLSYNRFCKLPKEITNLVNLSTLDLSGCENLKKLPQEMEKMQNLLSLDLAYCVQLHELPRKMGKLVNLVSLNLRWCMSLKELPRDMGKLVKLKHLWINGCDELRCMPEGIGNLTELEILSMFVVGENSQSWRGSSKAEVGAKLEELGHLNNLRGCLCIKLGEESKYILSEAGDAHLEKKTKLSQLQIVFKKRAEEDQKFLEGLLLGGENWKHLHVTNYGRKTQKWQSCKYFQLLPIIYYVV